MSERRKAPPSLGLSGTVQESAPVDEFQFHDAGPPHQKVTHVHGKRQVMAFVQGICMLSFVSPSVSQLKQQTSQEFSAWNVCHRLSERRKIFLFLLDFLCCLCSRCRTGPDEEAPPDKEHKEALEATLMRYLA